MADSSPDPDEDWEYDPQSADEPAGSDDVADGREGDAPWRFDLEDVDDEGIVQPPVEPGTPDPEHVLFVVLGAIATVLVFYRLWLLFA